MISVLGILYIFFNYGCTVYYSATLGCVAIFLCMCFPPKRTEDTLKVTAKTFLMRYEVGTIEYPSIKLTFVLKVLVLNIDTYSAKYLCMLVSSVPTVDKFSHVKIILDSDRCSSVRAELCDDDDDDDSPGPPECNQSTKIKWENDVVSIESVFVQ